jgi:glutamyl-tRNA synthetase
VLSKLRYYVWDIPERVLVRAARAEAAEVAAAVAAASDHPVLPVQAQAQVQAKAQPQAQNQAQNQDQNQEQEEQEPPALALAAAVMAEEFRGVDEADWNREGIEDAMQAIVADEEFCDCFPTDDARGHMYATLRWALLGGDKGLPMWTTIEILGRDETLRRLEVARLAAESAAGPLGEFEDM